MMRARLWTIALLLSTVNALHKQLLTMTRRTSLLALLLLGGCIFRIDIQQGNLLEEDDIDQVTVGMSRSAVQFLLGTPMVADAFHESRWDYGYYLRRGRSRDVTQRWLVVYFEDDRVSRLERDLELRPAPPG
jgi:outer membrane protein assembly factor BamE (lipoprotein component of BamABCDE complex)